MICISLISKSFRLLGNRLVRWGWVDEGNWLVEHVGFSGVFKGPQEPRDKCCFLYLRNCEGEGTWSGKEGRFFG